MPANQTTDDDASTTLATQSSRGAGVDSELAWGTTAFEPGDDVGLVARRTVGLVERDNPSTRERLWRLVSEDAPLDDILDELSSTGLKALPDFGLAQVEGSSIRIVARGRTTITAQLASGATHEVDPSGVRTWIEELVSGVDAITITLSGPEGDAKTTGGEGFAVLAGSVPARSLTRRYDAADQHADAAESGAGWRATDDDMSTPAPRGDDLISTTDVELEMVDDIDEPALASTTPQHSWFDAREDDSASVVPPQPTPPADDAVAPDDAPDDLRPDDLESADPQPADPEPADVRPADLQPASPQPPPPGTDPSNVPPRSQGVGGPPPATLAMDATVVVGSEHDPAREPVSSIFDDDFDDHAAGSVTGGHDTIVVGDPDEGRSNDGESASPSEDSDMRMVLVFSNGERVPVDRAILIGRNPKVSGAVEGALPHIMKFDGPGQGLSRTHAEVRTEGSEVVIEDLQSTNGTDVQLPGQPRRRLRGGEPVAIVPGTLIDFGDELHCTLEAGR